MSPWTLLGWLLLVLAVGYVGVRVLIVVLGVLGEEWPKYRAGRKHKRAKAGKVTCEYIGWENEYLPGQDDVPPYKRETERVRVTCARVATHSSGRTTWRKYLCEEHARKRGGSNDYPQPLNRPEPKYRTKVVGSAPNNGSETPEQTVREP